MCGFFSLQSVSHVVKNTMPLLPKTPATLISGGNNCSCPLSLHQIEGSAVIVELRPTPALSLALTSTLHSLPSSWPVVIVTSHENREWLISRFSPFLDSGRLHHWELARDSHGLQRLCGNCAFSRVTSAILATDNGKLESSQIIQNLAYRIHFRPELYLAIPSETYFVFQTDGFFCTPANISRVRSYAALYDFVGAPWLHLPREIGVGHGGFSLRSRSTMQRVIADIELTCDAASDDLAMEKCVSSGARAIGVRLPSYGAASSFSVESDFNFLLQPPIGFHRPWVFAHKTLDWEIFARMCPSVEAAMAANSDDCAFCFVASPILFSLLFLSRLLVGIWLTRLLVVPEQVARTKFAGEFSMRTIALARVRSFLSFVRAGIIFGCPDAVDESLESPWHSTIRIFQDNMVRISVASFFSFLALLCLRAIFLRCGIGSLAWLMRKPGHLSTVCAPGRLGNRLLQNIAVSMLAEKYDLATEYDENDAFVDLGLLFYGGSQKMVDGPAMILDDSLWEVLMARPVSGFLGVRLQLGGEVYFQNPAFAERARDFLQSPETQQSLLATNPWSSRVLANSDVFVHVRLGDLDNLFPNSSRSFTEYIDAIINVSGSDEKLGRVYVASDEPSRKEVQAIAEHFHGEVVDLERIDTWKLGMVCKHLVLSESTFSWAVAAMHFKQTGSNVRFLKRRRDGWMGSIFDLSGWLVLM